VLCMRVRSKKQLPEMTRPPGHTGATLNATNTSDTTTNPPGSQGGTHSIPSSSTSAVITPVGSTSPAHVSSPSHTTASMTAPIS